MNNRAIPILSATLAIILVAPLVTAQSTEIPRTEYGDPDFQGTYTFRTITPLNRPRELEHLEVLTPEQATEWEEFELRRQNRDLIIDSVGGAGYPPGVISYNNFWYERGDQTIARGPPTPPNLWADDFRKCRTGRSYYCRPLPDWFCRRTTNNPRFL